MVSSLLGKKIGMTQVFTETGESVPVTVIQAGPCVVLQVKSEDKDGYSAVQLGFDDKKPARGKKPEIGHAEKAGTAPKRFIKEVEGDVEQYEPGQQVTVDIFDDVAVVDVTGTTKGAGFAGVMKRWGFHGLGASHGTSKAHRSPGGIGRAASPSHIVKGTRMGGQMGVCRRTTRNLSLVRVDKERNVLLIKGSTPGPNGGYVVVRKSKDTKGKTS